MFPWYATTPPGTTSAMTTCKPGAGATAAWLDPLVENLNNWSFRIAVITSLSSHLYLVAFADIRRRHSYGLLRGILWLAYQLTEWAPGYVLGNLYLAGRKPRELITAFWVPFLLLNIRPDNIDAYSPEDNQISGRKLLSVCLQSLGAIYVLLKHVITGTTGTLRPASIIMYLYGFAKYLEDPLALWLGDLKSIRKSGEDERQLPRPRSFCIGQSIGPDLNYEQARLVAHDLLQFLKGAFSDFAVGKDALEDDVRIKISSYGWKDMYKVVQMELQLIYDLMYTRAAMVYTWHGYAIHLASPSLTAAALVLFVFHCKEGHDRADLIITYILLITTLLLDVMWLAIALGSTWTFAYLKDRPRCWFHHEVHRGGRWFKLRRIVLSLDPMRLFAQEPSSYRKCQDTIQRECRMLAMARTDHETKPNFFSRVVKMVASEDVWKAWQYRHLDGEKVSEEVKEFVFSRIWESLRSAYLTEPKKTPATDAGWPPRRRALDEALQLGPEVQQATLTWHATTDMFMSCSKNKISKQHLSYVTAIKALSEYVMYLAVVRPEMLPGAKVNSLCQATQDTLRDIRSKKHSGRGDYGSQDKELVEILLKMDRTPRDKQPHNRSPGSCEEISFKVKQCRAQKNPCNCNCHGMGENPCDWTSHYHCHGMRENPSNCSCQCHGIGENPCNWSCQCHGMEENPYNGSCPCHGMEENPCNCWNNDETGDTNCPSKKGGTTKGNPGNGFDEEDPRDHDHENNLYELSSILSDGTSYAEVLMHAAEGTPDWRKYLAKMGPKSKDMFVQLMPELFDNPDHASCRKLDMPVVLDLMLDTWVRMLIHVSVLCSRDSHARQLSHGGDLLTIVWILTAHARIDDHTA